jgi:hypothetical protein
MAEKRAEDRKEVDKRLIAAGAGVAVLVVMLLFFAQGVSFDIDFKSGSSSRTNFAGQAAGIVECIPEPEGIIHWFKGEEDYVDSIAGGSGEFIGDSLTPFRNGKIGKAFSFGGITTEDSVSLGDFAVPDEFSISMWVNIREVNSAQALLSKNDVGPNDDAIKIFDFGWFRPNDGYRVNINDHLNDDGERTRGWQHLAITSTTQGGGSSVMVYKNGAEVWGEAHFYPEPLSDTDTMPWILGAELDDDFIESNFFEGMIDELMFFDRPLGLEEIKSIYKADNDGICESLTCAQEEANTLFADREVADKFYCNGQQLIECTEDGAQQGDYVCVVPDGAESGTWAAACNLNNIYLFDMGVENDASDDLLCDGQRWLTRAQYDRSPILDPNVIFDWENGITKELICNNLDENGNPIDDDNDGDANWDDDNCVPGNGNLEYTLGDNTLYELVLRNDDRHPVKINAVQLVSACDQNSRGFADEVDICVGNNIHRIVSSDNLRLTNSQPFIGPDAVNSIVLFEPEADAIDKQVSFVHLLELDAVNLNVNKGHFARNLLSGQRLAIKYKNQYYILSYPEDQVFLRPEKLILTHIATGTPLQPINYEGTEQYYFEAFGGDERRIVVGLAGNDFVVYTLPPGQRPEGFVFDHNLTEEYEVSFTRDVPVSLIDQGNLNLTICSNDVTEDNFQVRVCKNGNADPYTILTQNQLSVEEDGFAYLYEFVNEQKQVSIFNVETLSDSEVKLQHSDFVSSMLAGNRITFSFENELYLLKHAPGAFHLPQLTLNRYFIQGRVGQVSADIPAAGSEVEVDFAVTDGRITITRPLSPELPFNATGLNTNQITEEVINLSETFFQSISNHAPANIIGPERIGVVSVAPQDIPSFSDSFKVKLQNEDQPRVFALDEPTAVNNVLFNYHTAQLDPIQKTFVKTMSSNLLVNVSKGREFIRSFDEEFINTITQGGDIQIVLSHNDNYYLFGHQGSVEEIQSFSKDKLELRNFSNHEQTFPREVDGDVTNFLVPGSKIQVEINDNIVNSVIKFRSNAENLNRIDFEPYQMDLTTRGKLFFDADTAVFMCELEEYRFLREADLCIDNFGANVDPDDAQVDHVVIDSTLIQDIGSEPYWLELNGELADNKELLIRQILPVGDLDDWMDWTDFSNSIINDNVPFIGVPDVTADDRQIGRLYIPETQTNILRDFSLVSHPQNVRYNLRNLEMISPVHGNGTFVLHDRVVNMKQQRVEVRGRDRKTEFQFDLKSYFFVPENNEAFSYNFSGHGSLFRFVTGIEGTLYTTTVEVQGEELVRISLKDRANDITYFNRLFAPGESREILLGLQRIEIRVDSISDYTNNNDQRTFMPTVSVRRIS